MAHRTLAVSVKTAQTGSNGWGVNEETSGTLDGANGYAVAFQNTGIDRWKESEVGQTLRVASGGAIANIAAMLPSQSGGFRSEPGEHIVVAFTERTRKEGRTLESQDDLAYALTDPGDGGRAHSRQIAGNSGVRRLTPVECCRLQAFDDDWNAWGVSEEGKPIKMSDSARYRQLGNAVCVNVAEWIMRRIAAVEKGEL